MVTQNYVSSLTRTQKTAKIRGSHEASLAGMEGRGDLPSLFEGGQPDMSTEGTVTTMFVTRTHDSNAHQIWLYKPT